MRRRSPSRRRGTSSPAKKCPPHPHPEEPILAKRGWASRRTRVAEAVPTSGPWFETLIVAMRRRAPHHEVVVRIGRQRCLAASLRGLDIRRLDDRGPALGVGLDHGSRLVERGRLRRRVELLQLLLDVRHLEHVDDRGVELGDDRGRGLRRSRDRVPGIGDEVGDTRLDEGRDLGQQWGALFGGDRQDAGAPALVELEAISANIRSTWLEIRSLIAGAVPRYGTCSILMPVLVLNSSAVRCEVVPVPCDA
jgi:hypothetical protein